MNEAAVTGYNVYRQRINAQGAPLGAKRRINTAKIALPGFEDVPVDIARYRYEVTAIDAHGNESPAAITIVEPPPR